MEGGKPVKRFTTLIIILFFISGILFGLDFGGTITDKSILSWSEQLGDYRESNLSLWMTTYFGENIKFFSQGSYTYSNVIPYLFELDFLNISSDTGSLFSYRVGRLWTADFSGYIFNHTMDGISAELNYPGAILSLSAGYTGLIFKDSSSVLISKADLSDMSNSEKLLASPRLIGGLDLAFPELFWSQDLNLSFWMQMDMRPESDLSSNQGLLQSQYTGLGMKGALAQSLYYDSALYLGTGKTLSYINTAYSYKNILSFMGSFGLRYYSNDKVYSKTGFKFIYSTGDSDYSADFTEGNTESGSTMFVPISRPGFALIFSPQLGNVFLTQFNYSIKPFAQSTNSKLKNIQTEVKASGFFRSTAGQISEPGINPLSNSLYLGTEIDTVVNFRLFSDLGIAVSAGVFLPDTSSGGAFLGSERSFELLGKAEFSFSF
jgi:hypothetical protein